MKFKKILLKTGRPKKLVWVHFCYVSDNLYNSFLEATGCRSTELVTQLERWAKEDFNIVIRLNTVENIFKLRKIISIWYKEEYKELCGNFEGHIHVMGWVRLWVSQHMQLEVTEYEFNCK